MPLACGETHCDLLPGRCKTQSDTCSDSSPTGLELATPAARSVMVVKAPDHQRKACTRGPAASLVSVSIQTRPTTRCVLVERSTRSCRSPVPPIVPTGRVPSFRTGQRSSPGPLGTEGPSASTRPGRIEEKPASSISSRPRPRAGPSPARRVPDHSERIERAATRPSNGGVSDTAARVPDRTVPSPML